MKYVKIEKTQGNVFGGWEVRELIQLRAPKKIQLLIHCPTDLRRESKGAPHISKIASHFGKCVILIWERGKNRKKIRKGLCMNLGHLGKFLHFGALGFFVLSSIHNLFSSSFYFVSPSSKNDLHFVRMKGQKEFKTYWGFEGFLTSFHPTNVFCGIFSAVNGFNSLWFSIM